MATEKGSTQKGDHRAGRLESRLVRWLGRESMVTGIETLSARFRLIEIAGPALRGARWEAGQKLQVSISGMKVSRTYTPMSWDGEGGSTKFLAWLHGDAPGGRWVRALSVGDPCTIFGPRRSIEISDAAVALVLVGDETAFGLGHALRFAEKARAIACLFETVDIDESRSVLDMIGLEDAVLVPRADDESHLPALERALKPHVDAGAIVVLAGRASAIQWLNKAARSMGAGSARLRAKAYWAPGKMGLD